VQARQRALGNIQFIGHLYRKKMLTEKIMHECIKKLLADVAAPKQEDLECLAKLMSTVGRQLDNPNAKNHMDAYFQRVSMLSKNMSLETGSASCSRSTFGPHHLTLLLTCQHEHDHLLNDLWFPKYQAGHSIYSHPCLHRW